MTYHNELTQALGLPEGDSPFPWQEELLTRFEGGNMPAALDVPTGLGKTAVMAVWLIARAQRTDLPRRLVYVVDRRAVVDQATTEAERLRDWIELKVTMKKALGLSGRLPISTLRGQHVDNREWLVDPASPAIIVGTVDMVGSRLLFEGYGVSRKMRSYHAGLLGTDTLVVLDEAHLVPPFERLLEAITFRESEFGPADGSTLVPPFRLMSLSATGRGSGENAHGLTAKDLSHSVLKARLDATKRVVLKPLAEPKKLTGQGQEAACDRTSRSNLEDALAHESWALSRSFGESARIITFCNSREVARKVKRRVESFAAGKRQSGSPKIEIDAELFVGGRRVFEREMAKQRLEQLGFLAGGTVPRVKPTFLFATSAAEVGVDLDSDHMVCDLVAWERMVQRLGRVNRRGDGDARVVVVVEAAPCPTKKQQAAIDKENRGEKPGAKDRNLVQDFEAQVRRWQSYKLPFERLPKDNRGFDASPGALRKLKLQAEEDADLKKLLDEATTPTPLRPALTRALVDAWSMTSLEKHAGRPEIDPWLRGWTENDPPRTAVVWRKHLPVRSGLTQPGKKEIEQFFEAAPPHASEILETETFRIVEWLRKRGERLINRPGEDEGERRDKDAVAAFVLARDGELRRTLGLKDILLEDDSAAKRRKQELESTLVGGTLVIDACLAGLKDGLLESGESTPPRTADDGQDWLGPNAVRFRVRFAAADEGAVADPNWRERLRWAAEVSDEGEARRWLIVDKWRHDAATEGDRSAGPPQLLDQHQSCAEQYARAVAKRVGLDLAHAEMLATAAILHDEGKRTRRWQRAFNAPAGGPYAKTKGPINFALLDGYRHELGSLPRAQRDERLRRLPGELQDLALHLIAAHHGFGRPAIGTNGCEDAPPSVVEERAREVALRFTRLQRRWGPWGLAWWEALLRSADWQASRDNDAVESATAIELA